jgi:hypothetical protein
MELRISKSRMIGAVLAASAVFLAACESTEEAVLPSIINIQSGDGQYSKKGTELPEPLAVKVQYHDNSDAAGFVVRFTVLEGGGTLSRTTSTTDGRGIASTTYTLGPDVGTNRIRAQLTGESNISEEFTATAGDFFCPEEDPTFVEQIPPRGTIEHDLLLLTANSRLNESGGLMIAGLIRLQLEGGFRPVAYSRYEALFPITVMDCAFAQNGKFFLAWQDIFDEVVRIRPNKQADHFASLETSFGGEITVTPSGVLVGCDMYGPFVVGCRDTLLRFAEATFSGTTGNEANFDAVAVDINPQSSWYEDIYYIDLSDHTLRRLPVDSLAAQGDPELVAQLSVDEAEGARGMECNDNGDVFILVDDDDDNVKAILRVTPTGVKTTEFDFFTRGTGSVAEAGTQRDLAIRRGGNPILYTIDTYNNMLLRYDVGNRILSPLYPDTTQGYDPESISNRGRGAYGERVGLVVIP